MGRGPIFCCLLSLVDFFSGFDEFFAFLEAAGHSKKLFIYGPPWADKNHYWSCGCHASSTSFFVSFHITHIQKPISKMPTCFYPHKQKYDGSIFMLLFLRYLFFCNYGINQVEVSQKFNHISILKIGHESCLSSAGKKLFLPIQNCW